MNNFCQSCEHWEKLYQDADKTFGECSNDFVTVRVRITQDEASIDDPTILTEATFGCKYWEKGELVVAKIKIPKR